VVGCSKSTQYSFVVEREAVSGRSSSTLERIAPYKYLADAAALEFVELDERIARPLVKENHLSKRAIICGIPGQDGAYRE
jgi:hypothetical protein